MKPQLSLIVQAGGGSQRMGQDKGLVTFLGQPLIARVIQRLQPIAAEVRITTNQAEAYAFLGVPLHADIFPGLGALSGLYTALHAARYPLVSVVACDMPFANAILLSTACSELAKSNWDAVIPTTNLGDDSLGHEPFHAVYQREACLPYILAALQAGKRRVDSWFPQANLRFLRPEEYHHLDPHGLAFVNINTPTELAQAETLARQLESEHET